MCPPYKPTRYEYIRYYMRYDIYFFCLKKAKKYSGYDERNESFKQRKEAKIHCLEENLRVLKERNQEGRPEWRIQKLEDELKAVNQIEFLGEPQSFSEVASFLKGRADDLYLRLKEKVERRTETFAFQRNRATKKLIERS